MNTQPDHCRRQRKKTPGICRSCGKKSGQYTRCANCRKIARNSYRKFYCSRRANKLCISCSKPASKFAYCTNCKIKHSESQKASRRRLKEEVFSHYGMSCACCGESELVFLQIDHIHNDGSRHRKLVPSSQLYKWLKKKGFPPGFQTLCANCNQAKRFGECPHQKRKADSGRAA